MPCPPQVVRAGAGLGGRLLGLPAGGQTPPPLQHPQPTQHSQSPQLEDVHDRIPRRTDDHDPNPRCRRSRLRCPLPLHQAAAASAPPGHSLRPPPRLVAQEQARAAASGEGGGAERACRRIAAPAWTGVRIGG